MRHLAAVLVLSAQLVGPQWTRDGLLGQAAPAAGPPPTQPATGRGAAAQEQPVTLLVPDRVWDGTESPPHEGWVVLVRGDRIAAVGARAQVSTPAGAATIPLPGTTL